MTQQRTGAAHRGRPHEPDYLQVERRENGVVVITFNRPDALNALSHVLIRQLVTVTRELSQDPATLAVIFCGKGRAFMAGGDVIEMSTMPESEFEVFIKKIQELTRIIKGSRAPYIAAMHGPTVGGGCEIACACDMRIAAEDAVFSFPETSIGFTSTSGVTYLLPEIVGAGWARRMLYLGEPVPAQLALRLGFVESVVPVGKHLVAALKLADMICKNGAEAISRTKAMLGMAGRHALEQALNAELESAVLTFREESTRHHLATRLGPGQADGRPRPSNRSQPRPNTDQGRRWPTA
jgi:enoyl-CoA hydratase